MKRIYFLKSLFVPIFLVVVISLSCKKESDLSPKEACGVRDPLNNLKWLRKKMDQLRQDKEEAITTVILIKVNGQSYIQIYKSYMSCSYCTLYTCEGDPVINQPMTQPFVQELMNPANRTTLWPK
ncbi:hypothetical protein [Tellurirhabdus bombi]|uniref:hypothetical protein n=1 Tax=Tellurirhabdus bombi TaxID=2907205 RepID=UPI001F293924|nr:hypothetical protein [Tellurirhabdus bombi]